MIKHSTFKLKAILRFIDNRKKQNDIIQRLKKLNNKYDIIERGGILND